MEPVRASNVQNQSSFFIKNPKIAALHHLDAGPQRLVFLFYPRRAFWRVGRGVTARSRKYRGFGAGGDYDICCIDGARPHVVCFGATSSGERDAASRVSTHGRIRDAQYAEGGGRLNVGNGG